MTSQRLHIFIGKTGMGVDDSFFLEKANITGEIYHF